MIKRIATCAAIGLMLAACGASSQHKKPKQGRPSVAECSTQTLANTAGVTCTRGGVTFTYGLDPYAATGPAPGPSAIAIVMDSNGSNATLVGNQANFPVGWSVGAGQVWSITIRYTVVGVTGKFSLAQLGAVATGDGLVTATQTAGSSASTITCTAATPCAAISSGAYSSFTPGQSVAGGVTLTLNGGTNGTASISQLSQHWQ